MSVIVAMCWLMDHLVQHVLEEDGVLSNAPGKQILWWYFQGSNLFVWHMIKFHVLKIVN